MENDMGLFKTRVDTATEELGKLQAARAKLEARAVAVEKELSELRAGATDRGIAEFLEGGEDTALQSKVARSVAHNLKVELEGFPQVRAELARRIREAILALGKARAEVLRQQAKPLQKDLSQTPKSPCGP
jgi:hypothetical protein